MLLLDSREIVLLLPRSQIIPFITVQWQSRKRLLRKADCVRSRSSSCMERDVSRDALMVELYRPGRVLESTASTERKASLLSVRNSAVKYYVWIVLNEGFGDLLTQVQ